MNWKLTLGLLGLFLTCSNVSANGLLNVSLLNVSYRSVVAVLGQPTSHKTGSASGIEYDQYLFSRNGWNSSFLFINGVSQRLDTGKEDDSPLTVFDKTAIFEAYDIEATYGSRRRGWRQENATHWVRGDHYVHVFTRISSITVLLKTLPSDLWPPNTGAEPIVESSQPQMSNPLDRGAYNQKVAIKPQPYPSP
jgi:hypothetical protein